MATIICDIDGTLLASGTRPIRHTIDWINSHASHTIALVTGRPTSERARTVAALKAAGVKYDSLTMNPGSSADTARYKEEVGRNKDGVVLAIDNNPSMRAAYRRAGIPKVVSPSSLGPETLNKLFWSI